MSIEKRNSILSLLIRLNKNLSVLRRFQLKALFILMILTSIAEIISVGAIFPFLAAIISPDKFFLNQWIHPFNVYFNFRNPSQILLPLTIVFILATLISGFMRIILLWFQTYLSYAIGSDLSIEMYRRTLYQKYAVHVSRNSSEIISGISSKANSIVFFMVLPILTILSSSFLLLAILIVLFLIQPKVTLITFTTLSIIY